MRRPTGLGWKLAITVVAWFVTAVVVSMIFASRSGVQPQPAVLNVPVLIINAPFLFWLWRRGPVDPVRRAREAWAEIEGDPAMTGVGFLKSDILALLDQRTLVTASLVTEGRDPKELICTMIANTAYDKLVSGKCHVYRGVLNYEGTQLRAAFEAASRRLVANGVLDQAAVDADVVNLHKEIKQAG